MERREWRLRARADMRALPAMALSITSHSGHRHRRAPSARQKKTLQMRGPIAGAGFEQTSANRISRRRGSSALVTAPTRARFTRRIAARRAGCGALSAPATFPFLLVEPNRLPEGGRRFLRQAGNARSLDKVGDGLVEEAEFTSRWRAAPQAAHGSDPRRPRSLSARRGEVPPPRGEPLPPSAPPLAQPPLDRRPHRRRG